MKRIRMKSSSSSVSQAEQARRRFIRHGQLLVSGEVATQAIEILDREIQKILSQETRDPKAILQLLRMKRDFNRQLLECAIGHLRDDKEPSSG